MKRISTKGAQEAGARGNFLTVPNGKKNYGADGERERVRVGGGV